MVESRETPFKGEVMLYILLCVFIVVVTICALPDAMKAMEKLRGSKQDDSKPKDTDGQSGT